MVSRILKLALLFILISVFTLPNLKSFAQVNLEEICQSIEKIEETCQTLSDVECRQLLEKCAKYYEEKSAQIEEDITKTEQEKKTLQNQIYILSKKIKNLDYQIYQSNLAIKDLGFQIEDTESSIEKTSLKIRDSRYQLANILQRIYEEDQKSLIEILLSEKELSDFFDDLMALEILNSKNQELLETIKSLKSSLESEKELLSEEKEDTERMVKIQALQKQESAKTKKEQEYFLKMTEVEYQKYLKEKKDVEKKAAEIRARIFELIGVPEGEQLPFGDLLVIAEWVYEQTGVRPAFLLSIITQESALGRVVGECYLSEKGLETGDGVFIQSGKKAIRTMSPGQVPDFLNITKELGRDPFKTPVSCVMWFEGKPFGWGGAMGPAQFMPRTWMSIRDQVQAIIGRSPNPWKIEDAFLASALYLKKQGALSNELTAAMRYFSGSEWSKWEERFYGGSITKRTNCLQVFIDHGTMTRDCEGRIFIPK